MNTDPPRIRDLPEHEREPFAAWLRGSAAPWIDGADRADQDAYYLHDYRRWKRTLPVIVSDPEILSGTPVFAGTRVPVKNLTDCLEAGDTIDRFLDSYPSVTREQVLDYIKQLPVR